jgi:hypothetical protein
MKREYKFLQLILLGFLISLSFLSAEGTLRVTEEHPFLINGEWIPASELEVGDLLTTIDGKKVKITNIEDIETKEPFPVYNLEAEEYSNFVVSDTSEPAGERVGVVVHNSGKTRNFLDFNKNKNQLIKITKGTMVLGSISLVAISINKLHYQAYINIGNYNSINAALKNYFDESSFRDYLSTHEDFANFYSLIKYFEDKYFETYGEYPNTRDFFRAWGTSYQRGYRNSLSPIQKKLANLNFEDLATEQKYRSIFDLTVGQSSLDETRLFKKLNIDGLDYNMDHAILGFNALKYLPSAFLQNTYDVTRYHQILYTVGAVGLGNVLYAASLLSGFNKNLHNQVEKLNVISGIRMIDKDRPQNYNGNILGEFVNIFANDKDYNLKPTEFFRRIVIPVESMASNAFLKRFSAKNLDLYYYIHQIDPQISYKG